MVGTAPSALGGGDPAGETGAGEDSVSLKIQYSVAHCDVLSGGYNTMLINTVFGGYANLRATALLRTKHVQTD